MRFGILITFLLFTFASGLVVHPSSRRRAEISARQLLAYDIDELDVRSPSIFSTLAKAVPKVLGVAKDAAKGAAKAAKGAGKAAKGAGKAAKGAGKAAKGAAGKAKDVAKKADKGVKTKAKGAATKAKGSASKQSKAKGATKPGKGKGAVSKARGTTTKARTKVRGAATKAGNKVKGAAGKAKEKIQDKKNGLKNKYTVPAGGGKPAKTYSKKDVKKAVGDANAENKALKAPGVSNRKKKQSPLKDFSNNNHHVPKKGSPGPNSLPKQTGKKNLKEYPLRTNSQIAANPKEKGPARVITKESKKGELKFKGVVAHDQSRAQGTPGANDHFQIKGTRK